jgi:hypothetical protein
MHDSTEDACVYNICIQYMNVLTMVCMSVLWPRKPFFFVCMLVKVRGQIFLENEHVCSWSCVGLSENLSM